MAENPDQNPLYELMTSANQTGPGDGMVKRSLEAIRADLGMEVAYVSEFVGNRSVFREVSAPGLEAMIKPGDSQSLDDVYCRHILEGRLPQLMPDTSLEPLAMSMPITHAVSIGQHMSVPIRLPDGQVHGMFCCLGFKADRSLHERDLQMMKVFADLTAFDINDRLQAEKAAKEKQERIKAAIAEQQLSILYQPIWEIQGGKPVGFECLTRFSGTPSRSPDKWFAEAAETGLGIDLELMAIRQALSALSSFPPSVYLAVNASPATVLSGKLDAVLADLPAGRIVLEITEHAHVEDYDCLLSALKQFRLRGVRLAVDDAGAGYASMQHILQLQPDLIKIDMAITRHIDLDLARRALASALVLFARETGSGIIAEGVETASELKTLRNIGIGKAQGYFLGRPMPYDDAAKLLEHGPSIDGQVA